MIEVKGLSHSFGGKEVLKDISLEIKEGTVTGLVGVNGAGKSTLLRLIAGVYEPQKGTIFVDGEKRDPDKNGEKIFFLPDDPFYTLGANGNRLLSLYKTFYPAFDCSLFQNEAEKAGLNLKTPLRSMSKGIRRQMFALIALAARPKYLLLDEAFDGLDVKARHSFILALGESVEKNGTAVLVASHSLRELEDFCDGYLLIDGGKIASRGALDEKLAQLCRFTLAYDREIGKELFFGLPVLHYKQEGRFVRLLLQGDAETIGQALEKTSPVVMERQRVDFEDLFIASTSGRKGL